MNETPQSRRERDTRPPGTGMEHPPIRCTEGDACCREPVAEVKDTDDEGRTYWRAVCLRHAIRLKHLHRCEVREL